MGSNTAALVSAEPPELVTGEVVAAFQLAPDGTIAGATTALHKMLESADPGASIVGTSLADFWHRNFLRPVADEQLAVALRNVVDRPVIEASPASPARTTRTLQLRPVDETDGTVTVVVNDVSELVAAQGRLMGCLAHERFLHLVSCDLSATPTTQPHKVTEGLTNALATYFNLAVAALIVPSTDAAGAPRILGFSAQSGLSFADVASLLIDLGFDRPHLAPEDPDPVLTEVWRVSLTSEQRQRVRTSSAELTCIRARSDRRMHNYRTDEVQLLALSAAGEPEPVDRKVLHQTLTQLAHFLQSTETSAAHNDSRHFDAATDAYASDLRRAVLGGDLVVHYQPEFDLATQQMVGAEALVRWPLAGRGMVPASEFIPLVTKLGLSKNLSHQVLTEACSTAAGWLEQSPTSDFTLRVNLSPRDVEDPRIVENVLSTVEQSGLPPQALCLEITESAVMHDYLAVLRHLNALADAGISLALDDFGTGYSSMWLLRELPFDTLKIDQVFVRSVTSGRPEDRAIIETMVSLGHAFDMTVTAEGIETPEQLAELRDIGVGIGQGFLLAKPAPKEDVLTALTGTIADLTDRRSTGTL